jgi:hypothetical protein
MPTVPVERGVCKSKHAVIWSLEDLDPLAIRSSQAIPSIVTIYRQLVPTPLVPTTNHNSFTHSALNALPQRLRNVPLGIAIHHVVPLPPLWVYP